MERPRLGTMLVKAKLLTDDQLKKAIDFQKTVGGKLGAIIVKLGFVSDDVLTSFLAKQQQLPIVDLSKLVLPFNLVKRVPKSLIEKHHVIPVAFKDGVLTLAVTDPFDYEAIEEIQLATNYRIEIHLATRESVNKAISDVLYAGPETQSERAIPLEDVLKGLDEIDKKGTHGGAPMTSAQLQKALVALLIEKGVVSQKELFDRARQMK
jgi:type IV pilus assembly protein PilB